MANPFQYNAEGRRVGPPTYPQNYGTTAANVTVGPGAKGVAVKELQAKLVRLGFQIQQTGEFDAATEQVLRSIQTAAKIPVTGTYGMMESNLIDAKLRQVLQGLGAGDVASDAQAAGAQNDLTGPMPAKLSAFQQLPTWQKGLMALGGIAVIGGIWWVLTKKSAAGVHTLGHGAEGKCSRLPDTSKFNEGQVMTVS